MNCWIGVVQVEGRRIVRLAGRLSLEQVPELDRACAEGPTAEIDLTDLVSADVAGIEALRRIRDAGGALVGTHGYIQLQIDSSTAGPARLSPRRSPDEA